jgi:hypothetical protein
MLSVSVDDDGYGSGLNQLCLRVQKQQHQQHNDHGKGNDGGRDYHGKQILVGDKYTDWPEKAWVFTPFFG